MNEFQNQLQKVISEINKASQRVVLSEKVEQLDLDVLLERIRKAYSLVIDLEVEQEMEQMPKVVIIEKEPVFEMVQQEEIKLEEIEQEAFSQEEVVQEAFFDTQEINDLPQEKEEPVEKKDEIPSVLKYLNEQMPKSSTISPIHIKIEDEVKETQPELVVEEEKTVEIVVENKAIEEERVEEIVVEQEVIEEPKIEEKKEEVFQELFFETPIEESKPKNLSNGKTIGEQYEQKKSIFENFSTNIKQDDISKRFNSPKIDLRTAIGVNEKFMFINDLFSGNLREYTDFIQRLNEAETLEMANVILNGEKENKRWVTNSLSYGTLTEILAKKFH
ncbi:MAG: hypothetical protein VB048_11660 [Bacteroidaceae bacterium]|nr:hypothetical protein [Bacteroidaceae bacterium]